MQRSRRKLSINVVVHMFILKNNQITSFPCFTFIPKTGTGLTKTGIIFCRDSYQDYQNIFFFSKWTVQTTDNDSAKRFIINFGPTFFNIEQYFKTISFQWKTPKSNERDNIRQLHYLSWMHLKYILRCDLYLNLFLLFQLFATEICFFH